MMALSDRISPINIFLGLFFSLLFVGKQLQPDSGVSSTGTIFYSVASFLWAILTSELLAKEELGF